MSLIQVNYLSRSLFRTVPLHVVLPVDKLDFWDAQIRKVLDWLPLDSADNGINSGNVKK